MVTTIDTLNNSQSIEGAAGKRVRLARGQSTLNTLDDSSIPNLGPLKADGEIDG